MQILVAMILAILAATGVVQTGSQVPVDPQTGLAIGARKVEPDDLKNMLDNKAKFILVDVREPDLFAKERIEGAVNIPMAQLETRLKEIPKDSTLVFT